MIEVGKYYVIKNENLIPSIAEEIKSNLSVYNGFMLSRGDHSEIGEYTTFSLLHIWDNRSNANTIKKRLLRNFHYNKEITITVTPDWGDAVNVCLTKGIITLE